MANAINNGFEIDNNPYLGQTVPKRFSGWGKFTSILGGIAGAIIPGIGGIIGRSVGGLGSSDGGFRQQQIEAEQMLQESRRENMVMLRIQSANNDQNQQFSLVTNLLKARHDGEMAAVQNLKS